MRYTLTPPAGVRIPGPAQPKPQLAPLNKASIVRRQKVGSRQTEIVMARTADGVWDILREEDDQTTWTVVHLPSGRHCPCYPNLRKARIAIASGQALVDVGEHWERVGKAIAALG
jgi:hypothetical protein